MSPESLEDRPISKDHLQYEIVPLTNKYYTYKGDADLFFKRSVERLVNITRNCRGNVFKIVSGAIPITEVRVRNPKNHSFGQTSHLEVKIGCNPEKCWKTARKLRPI